MSSAIPAPSDVAAAPEHANRTDNGIAYLMLKENPSGKPVNEKDWVKLHYTGWTTDGKMFDSSIPSGDPAIFPIDNLIPGMNQALLIKAFVVRHREHSFLSSKSSISSIPRFHLCFLRPRQSLLKTTLHTR